MVERTEVEKRVIRNGVDEIERSMLYSATVHLRNHLQSGYRSHGFTHQFTKELDLTQLDVIHKEDHERRDAGHVYQLLPNG